MTKKYKIQTDIKHDKIVQTDIKHDKKVQNTNRHKA